MPDEAALPMPIPPVPFLDKTVIGRESVEFVVERPPYLKAANKPGFKDQIVFIGKHPDGRLFQIPISLNTPMHEAAVNAWGNVPSKWLGRRVNIQVGIVPQGAQKGKPTFEFDFKP